MTEPQKPLDAALDLLLYAPVGLAITAAEELPKLAAKGRSTVNARLSMARVVGEFAVTRGRQTIERRFNATPAPASRPAPAPRPAPVAEPSPASFEDMTASTSGRTNGTSHGLPGADAVETNGAVTVSTAGDLTAPAGTPEAPEAGQLGIPGYDSLSASQVVQRLAGLSPEELAAVGAYERAHRGRRTILNRIEQLQ